MVRALCQRATRPEASGKLILQNYPETLVSSYDCSAHWHQELTNNPHDPPRGGNSTRTIERRSKKKKRQKREGEVARVKRKK